MRRTRVFALAIASLAPGMSAAWAGMAAPLPDADSVVKVLRLNGTVVERMQAASFFLLAILLCAAGVRLLWHLLRRDFPRLPPLSYRTSLVCVVLWGLLFVMVLAMVGGARELMTPEAWRKSGFTFTLDKPPAEEVAPEPARRRRLEDLRTALWQFAATHDGRFPSTTEERASIPPHHWEVPDTGGMRFVFVAGLSAGPAPALLAYEPELDPDHRLTLRTNGDILAVRTPDLPIPAPKEPK